jgi:hypothetical protein
MLHMTYLSCFTSHTAYHAHITYIWSCATHHAPHYTHLTKLNISCIRPCSTLHAPDLAQLYKNLFMLHISIPAHASCNINRSWSTKDTPDHAPHQKTPDHISHYIQLIMHCLTNTWSCFTLLYMYLIILHITYPLNLTWSRFTLHSTCFMLYIAD